MKDDKNDHTTHNILRENVFYPRHVSDRADELLDELEEEQVLQLYNELKTKTYAEWLDWLEDARAEISKYDHLSRAARKRELQKLPDIKTLLLHHACVYVELWREFLNHNYFSLPPAGEVDTPESQREMMLAVVAAYNHPDLLRALWPFSHPSIEDRFPFLRDS